MAPLVQVYFRDLTFLGYCTYKPPYYEDARVHKTTFNKNKGLTPFHITLTDFKYLLVKLEERFS